MHGVALFLAENEHEAICLAQSGRLVGQQRALVVGAAQDVTLANQFEAALLLQPKSTEAQKGLAQAQQLQTSGH